jgi:hypothetical protein
VYYHGQECVVAEFVRKNLIVDADALRELARERGTSESEAAREAISVALEWSRMAGALEDLRDLGAFSETGRPRRRGKRSATSTV